MCHSVVLILFADAVVKQSGYNVFDDNLCEILTVTVFAAVTFAAFFLEDNHFVALDEGFLYLAYYFSAFYCRSTYFNSAVHVGKEYAVELDAVAFLYIFTKVVNIQKTVFFCLELLSLDFYDNVH